MKSSMEKTFKELFSQENLPGKKLNIVTFPAPVLKKVAEPVTDFNGDLNDLVMNMLHTMYKAPGIGLAAPQVAVSKKIFVSDISYEREEIQKPDGSEEYLLSNLSPRIFINPEIIQKSGEISYEEGCLSFPGVYETIKRYEKITLKYQDIEGKEHMLEANELESICIQHELDHLNGIVFIEKLSTLKQNLIKKKLLKLKKNNKRLDQ